MEKNKINSNDFPRVLLVIRTFSIKSGLGITINNLFGQWPIDNFAISASKIRIDKNVKWEKFYQIGSQEEKYPFPVKLFNKSKKYSGVIDRSELINNEINTSSNPVSKNSIIKTFSKKIKSKIKYIGFHLFFSKSYVISNSYFNWIKEFKPDILYVYPLDYETAKYMLVISERLKIPMVVHIMDEYRKRTIPNLFYYYFERENELIFKKIVNQAKLNLSISDEMSDIFFERFGKKFHAFHNPVDLDLFENHTKLNWEFSGVFRILHAGNINLCRDKSIYNICKAIDLINSEQGYKVILDIFTPLEIRNTYWGGVYSKFNNVIIHGPIPHVEMINKLSSYDLLLLVVNFNEWPINYVKYSYSTSTSEYMASGTPILIYASPEVCFVKDAQKGQWAYVVSEEDVDNLKDHILKLINDSNLRERIARKAMNIAKDKDEINKVQSDLKNLFMSIVEHDNTNN